MKKVRKLETQRLIMRQWRDEDFPLFAQMCADPVVMEFFPNTMDRAESDALANKARLLIEENAWGFWVLEVKGGQRVHWFCGTTQINA